MKQAIITLGFLCLSLYSHAFCGFYVAKADADLFNESSQVIITRYDDQTVITMANDFQGEVEDFAMVVPVPVVLKEKDIRVAEQHIFDILDAYSGPRLAEYYDPSPCRDYREWSKSAGETATESIKEVVEEEMAEDEDLGVTIEAKYTVGEYDILILSAEQSDGLEKWLLQNEYKIPANAQEVLQPYIKDEMKFFVVKVNLKEQKKGGFNNLRPLQMSFQSERFGLPIRLGMANAKDYQDLIVYAITKKGRVETTNYRTAKIPTDRDIPVFVQEDFGNFYKSVYEKAWERESKKAVMLEYAWDLSSTNFVKCDPCVIDPPTYADLKEAGVHWVENRATSAADYTGDVFFTRLHVRYNRENYPQDLKFQETPNRERFQGRYVMRHPYKHRLDCKDAGKYLRSVYQRRTKELDQLVHLTGWKSNNQHQTYLDEISTRLKDLPEKYRRKGLGEIFSPSSYEEPEKGSQSGSNPWYYFLFGALVMLLVGMFLFRPK